jgi:hypothetical protein
MRPSLLALALLAGLLAWIPVGRGAAPSPGGGVAEGAERPSAPGAVPSTATTLFPRGLPVDVGAVPAGLASHSATGCAACHAAAHDSWRTGLHADTGRARAHREAVARANQSTACGACHLPLTAQHAELAAGYVDGAVSRPNLQPNPAFDATLLDEGVTCAACHVRDGTVLGTREITGAPHPVRASAALSDGVSVCAACHQLAWPGADRALYDTVGEWRTSGWAAAGVTCVDCHAPPAGAQHPGDGGGPRDHALRAPIARALTTLVRTPGAVVRRGQPFQIDLVVQNTGAGHAWPTGSPWESGRVEVRLLDSKGKEAVPAWTIPFARTVLDAAPWTTTADTRLPPGGQRAAGHAFTVPVKALPGEVTLEVRAVRGDTTAVLRRIPLTLR